MALVLCMLLLLIHLDSPRCLPLPAQHTIQVHLPGSKVTIQIATTHLESPEGEGTKDNFFTRRRQFQRAIGTLDAIAVEHGAVATVLCGDFNCTRAEEEDWVVAPWLDVWHKLQPADPVSSIRRGQEWSEGDHKG